LTEIKISPNYRKYIFYVVFLLTIFHVTLELSINIVLSFNIE